MAAQAAVGRPRVLLPQHEALIRASAISPEVAAARGYWSAQTSAELRRLGFADYQCGVPALVVPVYDVRGTLATYQIRPDLPRVKDGKVIKYETPGGSRMVIDVPPPIRQQVRDPRVPLFITEGVRKGDSAASADLCCIALLGVWNWRGTNEFGGKAALADWEYIPLDGREVYVCFDSDVMLKPQVHSALGRLAGLLERRRAKVHFVYLPSGPSGAKQGLDDYLAAGHTAADLLALASDELKPIEGDGEEGLGLPYLEEDGCLWWRRPTSGGEVPTRLMNFTAHVIGQIVRDDGAETQRLFEVEACLKGRTRRFSLSGSSFMRMDWPAEHLGAAAVVSPGIGLRDHARAAIQELSGPDIPERVAYAHLGWRKIGSAWHYLHAGGAIGPNGAVGDVEVDLHRELAGYQLPTPPAGEELRAAVRASLRLLDGLAPDRVIVPLFCMIWRAPLGNSDFSGYLVGKTGLYKTSVSALAQSHFGAQMDFGNLPADWKSTANYLETLAFAAKDVVLTVDDFVPKGSRAEANRLQRDADRLLRGQANRSGRGRLGADSTPRPPKPPRGLIVATGEDLPRGESLGARVFVVEFRKGDVDVAALTACQADAAAGLYAAAMAGYVQWLARRYAEVSARLHNEVRKLRAAMTRPGMHPRTPDITANLALGLRYFIMFATEVGAISEIGADALWQRGWAVLGDAAAAQAAHIGTMEPAGLFIRLLSAAITSGRAYIEAADGGVPANPQAWGWREQREEWQPQGNLVGWLDGEHLYLQPDASFAAAQAMGIVTGDEIAVSPSTLRKRLHERGLLASVDAKRNRLTVRHMLGVTRRAVLHLRADSLTGGDGSDEGSEPAVGTPNGPVPQPGWAGSPGDRPTSDSPTMSQDDLEGGSRTIGPVGPVSHAQEACSDVGRSITPTAGADEAAPAPCFACKCTLFWRDQYGVLKCAKCHAPPFEDSVTEWVSSDGPVQAAEQAGVERG